MRTRATNAKSSARPSGRGPGQPPLSERGDPARAMTLKLPPELYDEVERAAARAGLSVSKWARRAFRRAIGTSGARGRRQNGT